MRVQFTMEIKQAYTFPMSNNSHELGRKQKDRKNKSPQLGSATGKPLLVGWGSLASPCEKPSFSVKTDGINNLWQFFQAPHSLPERLYNVSYTSSMLPLSGIEACLLFSVSITDEETPHKDGPLASHT